MTIWCIIIVGCQAPQRVNDDIKSLKADEQVLFDFNQEFLKRANSSNNDELQKKLKITMISQMAHQRSSRGLDLLAQYLGSTEIITSPQLTATEDIIKKIADQVAEKVGSKDTTTAPNN